MARTLSRHQKVLRNAKRRELEKLANDRTREQNSRPPEVLTLSEAASKRPSGGQGISLFEDRAKVKGDCKLLEMAIKKRFPIRRSTLQGIMQKLLDLAEQETDTKLFLDIVRTVMAAEIANQRDEIAQARLDFAKSQQAQPQEIHHSHEFQLPPVEVRRARVAALRERYGLGRAASADDGGEKIIDGRPSEGVVDAAS